MKPPSKTLSLNTKIPFGILFSRFPVTVTQSCQPPVDGISSSDKTTYSLDVLCSTKDRAILPPFDSEATLKSIEYFDEELVKILDPEKMVQPQA